MYPWLHLGPATISTYSLCFLAAYIVGGLVTYFEARRIGRATEEVLQVAQAALGGGVIGAKLSMLIFLGPDTFFHNLDKLWYSGQAWTGGFFGGYFGVLLIKRIKGIRYSTGDIFALGIPLAQAIGRLGNLLGGDPFGWKSALPWALPDRYGTLRQPTALYELVLDLALFAVIWRLRDRMPRRGDLFNLYVVCYLSLRFALDFTRSTDFDPQRIFGLTTVQVLYAVALPVFAYKLWRSFSMARAAGRVAAQAHVETQAA